MNLLKLKWIEMKKLSFNVSIHASRQKIWKHLWDDASYRKWTSVFSEGSHAKSDWKEGSEILFMSPNGDGMFSKIEQLIPNEKMQFVHLGVLKNQVAQPASPETAGWEGARETYTLTGDNDDTTVVTVDLDSTDDFENYFRDKFPKALQLLKEMSEAPDQS